MLRMIVSAQNFWHNLKENTKGQGMVEYGLIIALVAVVAAVALGPVGNQLQALFNNIKTSLTTTAG